MAETNLTFPASFEVMNAATMAALIDLNEHLVEAQGLAATWVDLAGEAQGAPEWPFLVSRMVARLSASAEVLQREVREVLAAGDGL